MKQVQFCCRYKLLAKTQNQDPNNERSFYRAHISARASNAFSVVLLLLELNALVDKKWHQWKHKLLTQNKLTVLIIPHPLQGWTEPITALRCSCISLRSLNELKEHVNSTLAAGMSFMIFNIKQNIIIQYGVTSSSTGVGLLGSYAGMKLFWWANLHGGNLTTGLTTTGKLNELL